MTIKKEIIDELLSEYSNPAEILGETGLIKQLTKAIRFADLAKPAR